MVVSFSKWMWRTASAGRCSWFIADIIICSCIIYHVLSDSTHIHRKLPGIVHAIHNKTWMLGKDSLLQSLSADASCLGAHHAFRLSLPSGDFHVQQVLGWHIIIVGCLDVGHVSVLRSMVQILGTVACNCHLGLCSIFVTSEVQHFTIARFAIIFQQDFLQDHKWRALHSNLSRWKLEMLSVPNKICL